MPAPTIGATYWEGVEFKKAMVTTERKKPSMTAIWTETCFSLPALDVLQQGYDVQVVADAIGTASMAARKHTSKTRLHCELQRDWTREETAIDFLDVFDN